MSRWADRAAREIKATDLETAIVGAGLHLACIEAQAITADARRVALDALSTKRGRRQTASEDTWDLVLVFLNDRFNRRAAGQ